MTTEELFKKLNEDPDFINLKRFGYSLEKLLARHPEGVPDRIIAQALGLQEEDVEIIYEGIVEKIREKIL